MSLLIADQLKIRSCKCRSREEQRIKRSRTIKRDKIIETANMAIADKDLRRGSSARFLNHLVDGVIVVID